MYIYIYVMVGFVVLSVALVAGFAGGFGVCFWVLGLEQAGVTDGVR